MNLKKIEMYGFKSFADRINIEFTDNITAIVGPNGCGKSNVADAIRWVFGVQAPSAIRCTQMTDLIFNGTSSRRSLSYAEVSIFLDNEDRKYAIDFDEVVVTRKLYRNGDSEYLINSTTCRLKDIIELFRDTGIGKEGYSIIAQGMVQSIVTSKSEDRRKIFEEAAGIAKFRARKEETERKLERTQDNIRRLNDIKVGVESDLGPLEKQANDALKSKDLKEQLRTLEINNFLYQSDNNERIKSSIAETLRKTKEKIEKLETENEALQREYNFKTIDRNNTDIYQTNLHNEKSSLLVEQANKAGDSRALGERLQYLKQEIQRQNEAYLTANARIDDRNRELASIEQSKQEKNARFLESGLKYQTISAELERLSAEVKQKEAEVDKSTELIMRSQEEMSDIKTDAVKLAAKREMLLDKTGVDKDELSEKKRKLADAEKRASGFSEEEQRLNAELTAKENDLRQTEVNISNCRRELSDTQLRMSVGAKKITEIETHIRIAEENKRSLRGYQAAVQFLVGAKRNGEAEGDLVVGVIGEMLSVPKELQTAIEVALGGNVNNVVVETPEDASRLITYLRNNRAGRATFLPLQTIRRGRLDDERILDEDGVLGIADELIRYDKKVSAAVSHLLGRVVVVESRERAIPIARKYNNSVRMVTLDGSSFQVGGAITGGEEFRGDQRILSRESELEEWKKRLSSASKELEMLENDVTDKEKELENLNAAIRVLQAQKDKISVALATVTTNLQATEAEAENVRQEIDRLIGQNSEALSEIKALERQIAALTENQGDAASKREEADDYLQSIREELRALKEKRDEKQRESNECLLAVNTLKSELDKLDDDERRLKGELNMLHAALLDANSLKKTAEKNLEDVQQKIDTTKFSEEDRKKLDEIERQLKEIDDYKKRLAEEIAANDERRTAIQKELAGLNEKRTKDETNLENLDSTVETLAIRIREEYNLGYEEAVLYRTEEFVPETAAQDILKMKRRIDNIGPVNELAVEQYEFKKQEYEELSVQFEDLVKAEQDLRNVIADLKRDMETTFKLKFEQIGQNFEMIFRELFGGGSGKLELDTSDGKSILEAGIVIKAAPPGKNLKHLTLLSGGEQTLTAIAILFSIIKLNPLPFCILDEVEAALDDANAQLFAKYLKRFSETQFILITHKKPSMEIAGTLHGITMQEKGVSTRVSVQLKDANKYTAE